MTSNAARADKLQPNKLLKKQVALRKLYVSFEGEEWNFLSRQGKKEKTLSEYVR